MGAIIKSLVIAWVMDFEIAIKSKIASKIPIRVVVIKGLTYFSFEEYFVLRIELTSKNWYLSFGKTSTDVAYSSGTSFAANGYSFEDSY